jgi:arylsulfatase A-like enzyme
MIMQSAKPSNSESRIGPHGDAMMGLDYRTGQVLDAIKAAGVEDNTIVLWLSDNGAAPSGPAEYRGSSNAPFRGELGDALEGSIRTICMIKWLDKISPHATNEMVSIHASFRRLPILGRKGPHRPTHRRD